MKSNARMPIRIIAYLIDLGIAVFLKELLILYLAQSLDVPTAMSRLITILVVMLVCMPIILPLIYGVFISYFGGTIGKLVTGIEIISAETRERISFKRAFFRTEVGYLISGMLFFLGFIWIAIDKKQRGWHDMAAQTEVIMRRVNGVLIGLIVVFLLVIVNVSIFDTIVRSFVRNGAVYEEIFAVVKSELETSSKSKNPVPVQQQLSPTPGYQRYRY